MKLSCFLKCGDFLKDPSLEGGETESQIASEPLSSAVAVLLASKLFVASPAGVLVQVLDLPVALRASPATRQLYFPSAALVIAVDGARRHIHGLPLQPFGRAFTLACADLAPAGCSDDRAFQLFFLPGRGADKLTLLVLFESADVAAVSINLSTGAVEGSSSKGDSSSGGSGRNKARPGAPVVEAAALFRGPGDRAGLAVVTASAAGSVLGVHHATAAGGAGAWRRVHETDIARAERREGDAAALGAPGSSASGGVGVGAGMLGGLLANLLGAGLGQRPAASRAILQVEAVYSSAEEAPVLVVLHASGALSLVRWAGGAPAVALSAFRPPPPPPPPPGRAPDVCAGAIIVAVASVLPGVFAATWSGGRLSFLQLSGEDGGLSLSPMLCTAHPPVIGANRLAVSHPTPGRTSPFLHLLISPSPYTAQVVTANLLPGREVVRLCLQRDAALCSGEYTPATDAGTIDSHATGGLGAALAAAARHGVPNNQALEMHWHEQSERLARASNITAGAVEPAGAEGSVRYLLGLLRVLSDSFVASLGGRAAGTPETAAGEAESDMSSSGGASCAGAAHSASALGLYLHPSAGLVLGVARDRLRRLEARGRQAEGGALQRASRRLVLIDALIATLGSGFAEVLRALSSAGIIVSGSSRSTISSINISWLPLLTACPYAIAAALARRGVVTGAGGWLDCALDENEEGTVTEDGGKGSEFGAGARGAHLARTLHVLSCLPCSLPLDRYKFLLPMPSDSGAGLDFLSDWFARRALMLESLGFPFHAHALLQHHLSLPAASAASAPAHAADAPTPASAGRTATSHARTSDIARELAVHLGHFCNALSAGHLPPLTGLRDWVCLGDMDKFSASYAHLSSELRGAGARHGGADCACSGGISGGSESALAAALESGCTDEVEGLEGVPGFAHRWGPLH